MMRRLALALILAVHCDGTSEAFAMGDDYSSEELGQKGELVDGQTPVHGYWVNWEDTFFYSGSTAELNLFLEAYGKLSSSKLRVVIHSGAKRARSPWDTMDREIPVDWTFYRSNARSADQFMLAPTQVDVWLGDRIQLDDLCVPPGVEVASGGEIERFVERSQKQAAKVVVPDEAIKLAGQGILSVEFVVASAGWSLAPRPPGTPDGPIVLETEESLKNGGRFYVMLWGEAVGSNPDERTRQFKGKRVRAIGRVQVACPQSASTDYFITIDDAADIVVVE
jgi:hypothetical protein